MKKKLLKSMRVLLITAGLFAGVNDASATITKVLKSMDFNSSDFTWSGMTSKKSLVTDETNGGYYLNFAGNSDSQRRSLWTTFSDIDFTGITSYRIEFDAVIVNGNTSGKIESSLAITTSSTTLPTAYNYAFSSSSNKAIFILAGTSTMYSNSTTVTYQINGDANETVTLSKSDWYHYIIDVTIGETSTAVYTIKTLAGTSVKTGTYTFGDGESTHVNGLCMTVAAGAFANDKFDNFVVTTESNDVETVSAPTVTLATVNGANRTVNVVNGMSNNYAATSTTYFIKDNTSNDPTNDANAVRVDGASVTLEGAGTYYFYTVTSNGTVSDATEYVNVGEVTLLNPTVVPSGMIANGSYYNPVYAIGCSNNVEGNPTIILSATYEGMNIDITSSTFSPEYAGELIVTAVADGYTSSSTTINLKGVYEQLWQSLDYGTLSEDDIPATWTKAEDTGRWASWVDGTYYKYLVTDGNSGYNNITFDSYLQIRRNVAYLMFGFGIGRNITGSENINVLASSGDIVVLKVYNGQGKDLETNSSVSYYSATGTVSFGSNNSKQLRQATIYRPIESCQSVPVTNTFATYANHDYALDFSNVEGLTAYTATVSDDVVTFTKATQVPAGTGLLLKGATADVPVIASAAEIDNNALFAPTSAVSGLTYDQDGYYNYILTQPSGKSVGFYRANNNNVAVGKAYLRVSKENNTRRFSFIGLNGETEVTGISQIEDGRLNVENAVFNLNGQRVAEPKSGLYIVNGKKVVIK